MISRQAVLFLLALLTVSLAASPPAREAPGGRKPQLPLTDEGEFVVEPNPTYTHAYNWRDYVAVGSDGAYFLVAWYDGRRDERELYAARVSRTGTLLDPGGLLLATGVDEAPPAIGFDGVNYLVVWSDDDACDIHGARIACTGAVLDPGGFAISSAPRSQRTPRLAFDGANYLVAWADERNWQYHYEIFCARVAPSGAVLDPDGIPVSTSDAWRDMGGLVFNGSDFVVVWTQSRAGTGQDVLASRVSVSGVVLDPEAIVVSSALRDQRGARVASSGGISFVVWEDQRNYRTEVFGARVSQSGAVLDTGGSNYSVGLSAGEPAVSSDRTNFMLVWLDGRGSESVYGSRITQAGAMLDSGGFEIAHDANAGTAPALACGGSNYLVSWVHLYANDDVCCARVSTLGFVLDPEGILVSTAAPTQTMPAASSDGTDYLAVWRDERDDSDIYGVRLDPDGRMLDPRAFPVSEAEGRQLDPALAFNGIEFLAVWQDMRCDSASDVRGARITRDGTVLDPGGIPISTAPNWQYYVAVASDGLDFLAVWHDERPGSAGICGARVTSDGAVLDPEGILISSRTSSPILPAVAFDGTEFLVVWEEGPFEGPGHLWCARDSVWRSAGLSRDSHIKRQWQPETAGRCL